MKTTAREEAGSRGHAVQNEDGNDWAVWGPGGKTITITNNYNQGVAGKSRADCPESRVRPLLGLQ